MYDIVALGELLIDFTCLSTNGDGYPIMEAHPGGAPSNFLAAAAKYGARTALIGKVGADVFGSLLLNTMRQAGIETRGIVSSADAFTTLAFVTLGENGDRTFSFARKPGADTLLSADDVDFSMISESKIFHFGTLSLTDEPARGAVVRAAAYARERGKLITFDPNLRPPLWHDMNDAREQMLWGLSQADIVKISDNEVDFLWHISPELGAEKITEEYGAKLVFVTCGADGCVYRNKNAGGKAAALPGITVTDTTGAGDIFGGSAVSMIIKSGKAPDELNGRELKEIVSFASAAAGLSTTKSGGISSIPEYDDVMECCKAVYAL